MCDTNLHPRLLQSTRKIRLVLNGLATKGETENKFLQPPLATIMSDLFEAGSEHLDWTSDLGVSKPFTFASLFENKIQYLPTT